MDAILKTSNLSIGYRKGKQITTIMSSLTLSLNRGELVSVLGENGSGKSTLIRTLTGLQPAIDGEVILNGKSIQTYNPRQLSKLIAIVSTERTFAGGLLVEELVALGRQPYTGFMGRLDALDKEIIHKSMSLVGIEGKRKNYVAELSDGERQKAMIAKALAQEAEIIILDEPTAFLDVKSRLSILVLLHKLAHDENRAILVSSHDIRQSLQLSDKLWMLCGGQILCGGTEDLILSDKLKMLFPESNITFDLSSGDFEICKSSTKQIKVISKSSVLKKWLENALKRNNYIISDEAEDIVEFIDTNELHFSDKVFNSIENLIKWLNQK